MKHNRRVARARILRRRGRKKAAKIAIIATAAAVILFTVAMMVMATERKREPEQAEQKTIEPIMPVEDEKEKKLTERVGVPSMDWDADESYLLARMAMAEAEGESTEGKAMVMLTVLNRVWSDDFPGTIEEVIFEEHGGTYQFSPVQPGGRWWDVEPDEDCWKALYMIMVEHWDESEGALYFEATYNGEDTWHSNNLEFIKTVGNHNFYK